MFAQVSVQQPDHDAAAQFGGLFVGQIARQVDRPVAQVDGHAHVAFGEQRQALGRIAFIVGGRNRQGELVLAAVMIVVRAKFFARVLRNIDTADLCTGVAATLAAGDYRQQAAPDHDARAGARRTAARVTARTQGTIITNIRAAMGAMMSAAIDGE